MAETSPHNHPHHANGELSGHATAMLSSPVTEAPCRGSIPVIDFDILVNGTADQRSQAIRDLGRACEDWGVFMVVNHGVSEALQQTVMEAFKELMLSSPDEEKAQYMEAGHMDPIRIGTGYSYSAEGSSTQYCRHFLRLQFAHPELCCPAKPENLRPLVADLATQTRDLMLQLGEAMSQSLGLDTGRISEALKLESCYQTLMQNLYPACSDLDNVDTALPPHTDNAFLTLLFQNSIDGLEVKHNGQWILAKPVPGAVFILAGDQLEILSNERYRAVIHRARITEQERISFVSVLGPCLDAVVKPLHELAAGGHGVEFQGIKFEDYILTHLKGKARVNGRIAMDVVRAQHDATGCSK